MTASIGFLLGLFSADRPAGANDYVASATGTVAPDAPKPMPSFAFNHLVLGRGHQFLYDSATLEYALTEAGFTGILQPGIGASQHPSLRGLEAEDQYPDELPWQGSVILEGTRPLTGPLPRA